jgi:hypothetical protein
MRSHNALRTAFRCAGVWPQLPESEEFNRVNGYRSLRLQRRDLVRLPRTRCLQGLELLVGRFFGAHGGAGRLSGASGMSERSPFRR